jgi:hypothetical protein
MVTRAGGIDAVADVSPQRFPVKTWLIAFAGWMFDFYDLVLFSFLLIPIGRDMHLTVGQEAWLLGVALGASGVGGIVFGYLSDVFGRKRVMMWTICLYSFGTALTALSTGPGTLLMFRLLTGLGIGGEWAVGHALMAESTPIRMRGRAAALLQAGEPVGLRPSSVFSSHRSSAGATCSSCRRRPRPSPSSYAVTCPNRLCGASSERSACRRRRRWPRSRVGAWS